MAEENIHKKNSESSVEENIAQDYIPKAKLGDMAIPPEVKKEMDKAKEEIEQFKKTLLKDFKYIEAIGILPAQANAKIEEEYEVPEEEAKKKLMHILVLIPEDNFKEIGKVRLKAIDLAKNLQSKTWVHVMTPVDLWNLCLDSKFEIAEAIAMSYPIMDKGILGAMRVAEIHKTLVLKKFEKYVTSYVIAGSMIRGTTKPTSDIDVFVIIDDTDVKRMPRLELKEKLRSIIFSYINEAIAIAGVKNSLHVQTYLLTEFWESVKDANPVIFTFVRDGVPMYDRFVFLPWKSLLRMGKIKPSPESIDMFMSAGDKLEENIDRRLLDVVVYDLFWGISTPSQALLMLYGLPPPDVYGTVKQIREVFVEKEKILEKRYADILEEISIKYFKGWEHGKIKKISGSEVERLTKDALDYMKRLKELRSQIEKRVQEKSIEQVYGDVFSMLEAMLKKKSEKAIIDSFEEEFVKSGRFPKRFVEGLKFIAKVKTELAKDKKKGKKDKTTNNETRDVEDARKISFEIVNALMEYNQRCDMASMEKSRFVAKTKDKKFEVFFLKDVFVVDGSKIQKLKDAKLVASDTEELRRELAEQQKKEVVINEKALASLKNILGDFELVC